MSLDWTDKGLEDRLQRGWSGGLGEGTACGNGSLMRNTRNARAWLPFVLKRYGITTICDAGAGDGYWAGNAFESFIYRAFDLHPRAKHVTKLDITKEYLPECDAIICRLVFIHLDPLRIEQALERFRFSARYIFASQYDNARPFNPARQDNHTNLRPLLGAPLAAVQDSEDAGCSLALWDLRCTPIL